MTPKPYKENKSSLRQFLEKNSLAPVPKEARGKRARNVPTNKYYLMLKCLWEIGNEEDKARLEAVSWNINLHPQAKINKFQWERVEEMRQSDGENDPNNLWYGILIFSGGRTVKREKGYYVAGIRYESKEAFMLSRTGLGRELM